MPDPTKKTISATESPALFNRVSPYVTLWMLWQKFARGMDLDSPADARMTWGKKLQPLIIDQAAEDLKFEVIPNADDSYHRRGLLGCTRDATIICPDRGPGRARNQVRVRLPHLHGGLGGRQGRAQALRNPAHSQQMAVGDGEKALRMGRFGPPGSGR